MGGNRHSKQRKLERQLQQKEAAAKDEIRRLETDNAQQQAQNERLEREKMEGNLKAERTFAQLRAETARNQMEQQRQYAESKLERERGEVRRAEERGNRLSHDKQRLKEDIKTAQAREENVRREMHENTRRLESEKNLLQLEMEKRKGENETQLTKKEEELRRSQLEASNLHMKMDCERAVYDQTIAMKDGEVAEARNTAEVVRVEKDMMTENLMRNIQEQTECRVQERKETEDKLINIFQQWGKDKDTQHEREIRQQIEFRKEMSAENEKNHRALVAANTQNMEFVQRLQNETSEFQAKQIERLTMGLQGMIGSGQPTAKITSRNSSAQTSTIKQPIVLNNPGIVLIDNFKREKVLKNVQDDEDILQDFFEDIQADVKPVLNGKFLTRSARQCQREDYSLNDGIIVFLFSYGNNMTLQDDSREVDMERIIDFFIKNSSLVNKPKIFLVQAMLKTAGEKYQKGKLHNSSDYLLCYFEMEEETYIENANESEGSLFVKYLHDAFTANKNHDIGDILKIVESSMTENINADFSYIVENKLKAPVQLFIP